MRRHAGRPIAPGRGRPTSDGCACAFQGSRGQRVRSEPTSGTLKWLFRIYRGGNFGGVPGRVRYDNLRTAVTKVLLGRDRVENERFVTLRSHYMLTELPVVFSLLADYAIGQQA